MALVETNSVALIKNPTQHCYSKDKLNQCGTKGHETLLTVKLPLVSIALLPYAERIGHWFGVGVQGDGVKAVSKIYT